MANVFKIVSGEAPHRWCIDEVGALVELHEDEAPSVWVDDSVPLTKEQADTIRQLIVACRKDGSLDETPLESVQYPNSISSESAKVAERYLRTWPELLTAKNQDLQSAATQGICWDVDWDIEIASRTAPSPASSYEWVAGEPVAIDEKPAASEEEEPQGEETLGGEEEEEVVAGAEMVPGQVCSMEGDKGEEVQAWQTIANEIVGQADLDSDLVKNDGVFGPKTVGITEVVQDYLGVPVTGACDQETWDTVLNLYN